MIARKVKPGILEIIDVKSQDELESYTLLDITDKDAYLLATTAKNFNKEGNVVTINYENGDDVDKMFKAIAKRHREDNADNFIDVSKKYTINKDVVVPGTSVLLRDAKTHVIRVCYRKTTNSTEGNINRLFITNDVRDRFFKDVVKGKRYSKTNKYELDTEDKERYSYWSNYMNEQYLAIMRVIKETKGA